MRLNRYGIDDYGAYTRARSGQKCFVEPWPETIPAPWWYKVRARARVIEWSIGYRALRAWERLKLAPFKAGVTRVRLGQRIRRSLR